MAYFMLVRHKVEDFSKWKQGYDTHQDKRIEAGLTDKHLLHGVQDANEVVILFEADDLGKAKEFIASDDLRETMQHAGVIGKPDIYFLEE